MPFFSQKKSSPEDIINETAQYLNTVLANRTKETEKGKKAEKSSDPEKIIRTLHSKLHDSDPTSDTVAQLCHLIYNSDLLISLIKSIPYVEFESRKDVIEIISFLLHRQVGVRMPTVDYILSKPDETLFTLMSIYENQDSALHVGIALREIAKNADLCRQLLMSPKFFDFFQLAKCPVFDIATDSYLTMREFLMRHPSLCCEFLKENFDKFFKQLNELLIADNYAVKRQSLKILGELLFERQNHEHMIKYVSIPDNLKIIMNLLCNKSVSIQHEAFYIFKVFVANPTKAPPIVSILNRNKSKLIEYLEQFPPMKDSSSNEQFNEEKEYLIKCISQLPEN